MNKTTYYIFRHALATRSKNGYGDQIISAPILTEGIPPIHRIANYLRQIRSDFNVSSTFLRCRQTVEIVSAITEKQFIFDERLGEYNNESFVELHNRIWSFMDEISSKNFNVVLICTHGAVIAGIKHYLLNHSFQESDLTDHPIPGILSIIMSNKEKRIDFN